jgi:cation diffusion facilitator CzcD-associated flavoprotein CzcO
MSSTDTAIIGAGPYGLSLAAHLKAAGVPHQIIGRPMDAWRNYMPPGMLLRSEAFASNLYAPQPGYTLEDYCRRNHLAYEAIGMPVPLEQFVDYGLWFQSAAVGDVRIADVMEMHRVNNLFQLRLSDGNSLAARRVVLALGLKGFAKTPVILQGFPESHVSHSALYGSLNWARQKDIAIVGGGQSALGLAALLVELGARVHVLIRGSTIVWHEKPETARGWVSKLVHPDAGLGRGWRSHVLSEFPILFHMLDHRRQKEIMDKSYGPAGAWWLRDRVLGKVKISLRTEVRHVSIDGGQVALRTVSDGAQSCVMADHVVAATGFKTDLRRHEFISTEILDSIALSDGLPQLSRNFETSIPGLYVVGPATAHNFGPVMRFVYGAKHTAPRVAAHIGNAFHAGIQDEAEWSQRKSPITDPAEQRSAGSL